MRRVSTIGRVEFNLRHFLINRPLLIEKGGSGLRPVVKWTPEHLASSLGQKPVVVQRNEQGLFDYNQPGGAGEVSSEAMPLSQAMSLIDSPEGFRYYLQQKDVARDFPELLPDVERPWLVDGSKLLLMVNIWIGGGGNKSPLHYDAYENLFVQVFGRKKLTLFPPSASRYLYPATAQRLPHCSLVNVFAPDLDQFPLYEKARPAVVEVEPGDLLYLPRGWWHAVEALSPSISLNYWWNSPLQLLSQGLRMSTSTRGRKQVREFVTAQLSAIRGRARPSRP